MSSQIVLFPFPGAASRQTPPEKRPPTDRQTSAEVDKDSETFKLLLVDDNVDLLEMTSELLREAGFEVLLAASGKEALEVLGLHPNIDAVLTDVVMPGMSGLELGRQVRKQYPSITVILVSGYPNFATEADHGSVYEFSFLKKPYRTEQVIQLLLRPN